MLSNNNMRACENDDKIVSRLTENARCEKENAVLKAEIKDIKKSLRNRRNLTLRFTNNNSRACK